MTTTISRLYDTYSDAEKAVRALEVAGVPHSDISIVANNSDSLYGTDKKVDRDRDGVDDRAEGEASGDRHERHQRNRAAGAGAADLRFEQRDLVHDETDLRHQRQREGNRDGPERQAAQDVRAR